MGHTHASRLSTALRLAKNVLCLGAAVFSWCCLNRPLEPVVPIWDTNVSVPLLNRSYTLSDLVQKDTSLVHVGTGGQIIYTTSAQVKPTFVGDMITLALRDTVLRPKFGTFKVTVTPLDIPIQFPWLPQGVTIPIPDTTLNVPDLRDTITSFERVTFKSGEISLALQNNLPVTLRVMNPLYMIDTHGTVVASFVFSPDTIPPHNSREASDNLAGKTLDNIVTLTGMSLHTAGSRVPVPIPFGTLFSAHLTTANLKARQAIFANVPPQRLSDSDTTHVTVDDSTLIRELHVKSGEISLAFVNHIGIDLLFKFSLLELFRLNGTSYVSYEDSLLIPAAGSGTEIVSLTNAKISSRSQDLLRSLEIISSVVLPSGSSQPVTLNDTDRVLITVTRTSPIVIDSAIGVLKPTWVAVNTVVPVRFGDIPKRFSGQLSIPAASLALWTNSTVAFPMDLNIRIGARKRNSADSVFVYVPVSQRRVQSGPDVVLFDQGEFGGFLSQFSSGLPQEFRVEGRALVNPPDCYDPSPGGVGAIGSHGSLSGKADIEIPLVMGIVNGTYRDTIALGDTTADGHKDYSIDKKQINNVSSGLITIEVKNAMPVQVGALFQLLDIGKQSLLRIPQSGSLLSVSAASVDGQGNVTVPASSTASFQLNESEVRQFNPAEYVTVTFSMATTAGAPMVRFKTSDSVHVRSWTVLRYRTNQ